MMRINIILIFLFSFSSFGRLSDIVSDLQKSRENFRYYPRVVETLVNEKLYFSSIPYIKEYLAQTKYVRDKKIDKLIDEIITHVGVRQFEILSSSILKRSNAPTIKYILAKKAFRKGKYKRTISLISSISKNHPIFPFSQNLVASSYSILKKYNSAIKKYKVCVAYSKKNLSLYKSEERKRQLAINRDTCLVGIARSQFAKGDFKGANLSYLDLSKDSFLWPEVLYEEAWTSFYKRNYNRALGKLVTYRAPILNFIFNPEADLLQALTFMEMCLWADADRTIKDFFRKYEKEYLALDSKFRSNSSSVKYFYHLIKNKRSGNEILDNILRNTRRDAAFREMFNLFKAGKKEIQKVNRLGNSRLKTILSANLKESMVIQRDLIGAYVRQNIYKSLRRLKDSLQSMSYIKLEVLSREKEILYNRYGGDSRKRGDFTNLDRNEKQYFWSFNGEFWADELGDYVFGLKSECR